MEHSGRLQVYHHRQGPYRMGVMCALQPEPPEPGHCQRWMGQACQGTWFSIEAGRGEGRRYVRGCFATYKYLLLQSFRAMRQPFTNALMTVTDAFLIAICLYRWRFANLLAPHRFGSLPPAAFKPTTSATLATSTPLPSPLTAPSAPQAVKTAQPCSGISTSPSIYTP